MKSLSPQPSVIRVLGFRHRQGCHTPRLTGVCEFNSLSNMPVPGGHRQPTANVPSMNQ